MWEERTRRGERSQSNIGSLTAQLAFDLHRVHGISLQAVQGVAVMPYTAGLLAYIMGFRTFHRSIDPRLRTDPFGPSLRRCFSPPGPLFPAPLYCSRIVVELWLLSFIALHCTTIRAFLGNTR